ncbi:uncharacterized protein YybS (DUF2232 family) [Desulfitispora alkaliphila]|uniref:YybS family protein n=1 Tax=Desulfitispora alkaliphila TaxID=622674 RepID=UPI003D1EDABD
MASKSFETKALVEGAMAASLATMLAAIGYFIPVLQVVTTFIWFIPIIVVIMRQDLRTGVMALIVTALLLGMLVNPVRAVFLLLGMGPASLVFGYGFKQRWPSGKVLLSGGVVVGISALLGLVLSAFIMGFDLTQMRQEMLGQADATVELYRQMGLLDNGALTEEEIRDLIATLTQVAVVLLPSVFITGALFTGCIGFLLARMTLKRLNYQIEDLPPFREWQLPWYFVWGFILALALLLIGDYYENQTLINVSYNIFYIYAPILLISGISVIAFFNHRWKASKWIKLIILVVILLNLPFALMLAVILGLFDPLFSYRKLVKNKDEEKVDK